jgi:hypothetical protein
LLTSPLMRCLHLHRVQRQERASRSRPNPLFSSSPPGTTACLGSIVPSWPGPWAHPVRVCGAKLQPEDALSLPEPAERLAGDPVVTAPLPIPADRFGAERSVGVGDSAAFPVLLDPLDGLPIGPLTLDAMKERGLRSWRMLALSATRLHHLGGPYAGSL